ncbi:MAG: acyl-CoA dehydrogenase family protein, partial [Acidimicrobiales bacterium]
VHRFAAEDMRPTGIELDRLADPEDVIATESPIWKLYDRFAQMGLHDMESSGDLPPLEAALLNARIGEEMGWGDAGLSISLGAARYPYLLIEMLGNDELKDLYLTPDPQIGCWAITEADHGSDSISFRLSHGTNVPIKPSVIAHRDGDEYVLSGSKSAWVSNGVIAQLAGLHCAIEGDGGFAKGGICIVPLDLSGVTKGKNLDKLGQRPLPQGEIHFNEARIPASHMIVDENSYGDIIELILALANAHMGSTFSGLARASYELALDYAKERVQGGVPIIEHQHVQSRLLKMFAKVQAAAALSRQTRVMGAALGGSPPLQNSIASKIFCTNTAFEVASEAVQIFGGNGLTREYPIEKMLRDARSSMIEDGCNEMLSILGGAKL